MAKTARKQPKIGYFIQSQGPGDRVEFEEVYVYGPTYRRDEGIVGHDLRMRPTRLGVGDYTFVGSPEDVKWTRPGESQPPKKAHAQIKREVDEILARKPGRGPRVSKPSTRSQAADCPCAAAGECTCQRVHFTERCACPACKGAVTSHATIAKYRSWQGTDSNERLINGVRNGLVAIYLDGVVGVSPVVGEYGWKQIEPDKADFYLQKGRKALDDLVSQKAPPSAKDWLAHKVKELRDLIEKAQAVRDGVARQKMTAESYAELRRSLMHR